MRHFVTISILTLLKIFHCYGMIPVVVNTWSFTHANVKAWSILEKGFKTKEDLAIEALEEGCKVCQDEQCDHTVGYGGSPDENGETTLDALIFDGLSMDMGAVGGIRRVKNAIGVARHVLENTEHSLLVGSLASQFAENIGYRQESLNTNHSILLWQDWKDNKCQPNFWKNVHPDPRKICGPYKPGSDSNEILPHISNKFNSRNHDTIGMIVISKIGHIVAGTSTNGAKFKVPGRVGDSPIPGAGAFADNDVGAAVGTGDGDIMMRFLPSF